MTVRPALDQYQSGSRLLLEALRGLSDDDLRRRPPADAAGNLGQWSIQQVAIHLADAEMVYAERMKRVIAEDTPPLRGFDEARWAERLNYDQQSAADAAALVELVRRQTARLLATQPDAVFDRCGIHNEAGSVTLHELVQQINEHLDHHIRFITAKRQWLGKTDDRG